MKNYISVLIIKFWMWLWFEIDTQFSWFKKYWIDSQRHDISQILTLLLLSIKSFFICIINIICKEVRWRITFLHWLSSSECNHNSKSILNSLDSRNKMSTSYLHIKKNMILKLIWNQKKLQTLNLYTTCHETNFKYYNNILINIL